MYVRKDEVLFVWMSELQKAPPLALIITHYIPGDKHPKKNTNKQHLCSLHIRNPVNIDHGKQFLEVSGTFVP